MLQELILVLALCVDAFVASFSYGAGKIKIPLSSAFIISSICSVILMVSLIISKCAANFIPSDICRTASFCILMCIGIANLFQNGIKAFLRKHQCDKTLKFKYSDINFVIAVYLDETKADSDNSKALSSKEAFALAIALSIDSLASGFGVGLVNINITATILLSLACGLLAIILGGAIGKHALSNSKCDFSWLSGAVLVILAFMKL